MMLFNWWLSGESDKPSPSPGREPGDKARVSHDIVLPSIHMRP